jgi:carbamoyl-phosphate synthase large subunit
MRLLFCTIGRRGYIVDYFKENLPKNSIIIGTSDRNDCASEFTSAFHYCDKNYVVPSIINEQEYIEKLIEICKIEKIDALLSFYDLDNYVLSKYIDVFKSIGVKPVISSFSVNEICFDKIKTFEFMTKHGFNTPWTMSAKQVEEEAIPSYPVIVKPRFGFGSKAINIARNKEEVAFFINYYSDDELIVQQFLQAEEYSFDVFNDFDNEPVTAVIKKKIKMRGGETAQGFAFKNEKLIDTAYKLGHVLGHVGPLDVDFFLIDDVPYILELNPRFGGGYPITHLSGVDFTGLVVDLVRGTLNQDYTVYQDYNEGIVAIKDIKILVGHC